jgi:hypothetical protein
MYSYLPLFAAGGQSGVFVLPFPCLAENNLLVGYNFAIPQERPIIRLSGCGANLKISIAYGE